MLNKFKGDGPKAVELQSRKFQNLGWGVHTIVSGMTDTQDRLVVTGKDPPS